MNKLYQHIKSGTYGILDDTNDRIYWINDDLSPIWSNYVHGQKSMYFDEIKSEVEFITELDFDYVHVTDLSLNASLD